MTQNYEFIRNTPPVNTKDFNLWETVTGGPSSKFIQIMRTNPGETYLVLDPSTKKAKIFTDREVRRLQDSAPKPYRVISIRVKGRENQRVVWISNNPAYWQDIARRNLVRKAKK